MINHLDAAKGILGRDYVDAEDREFALVHALVAIAERLTVPPRPVRTHGAHHGGHRGGV